MLVKFNLKVLTELTGSWVPFFTHFRACNHWEQQIHLLSWVSWSFFIAYSHSQALCMTWDNEQTFNTLLMTSCVQEDNVCFLGIWTNLESCYFSTLGQVNVRGFVANLSHRKSVPGSVVATVWKSGYKHWHRLVFFEIRLVSTSTKQHFAVHPVSGGFGFDPCYISPMCFIFLGKMI